MEDGVIAVDVRRRADTPATRGRPPTVHASSTSPRRVCLRARRSPPGSSSCPHHLRPQGTRTAGISEGCESRGLHEQHGARQKWWRSRRCRWQATPSQHCPTGGGVMRQCNPQFGNNVQFFAPGPREQQGYQQSNRVPGAVYRVERLGSGRSLLSICGLAWSQNI